MKAGWSAEGSSLVALPSVAERRYFHWLPWSQLTRFVRAL